MPKAHRTPLADVLQIGCRHGRLEVIGPITRRKTPKGQALMYVECRCDCGTVKVYAGLNLKSEHTQSCGCQGKENLAKALLKHGKSRTPLYMCWGTMIKRCENPNAEKYPSYGGRGIRVCPEWREGFVSFRDWALANGYEEGLTIERKCVDGDYCPANCTWITKSEQSLNKRDTIWLVAFGERKQLLLWIEDPRCKVSYHVLRNRIKGGEPAEEAMTRPSQGN